jgi:hypothetical protein
LGLPLHNPISIGTKGYFMNGSLIEGVLGQLQGAPTSQIAQQLGIDPAAAQSAIASALPLIVGTLGHHAQRPGGAGVLLQALQQGQPGQGQDTPNPGAADQGQSGGANSGLGGMLGSMLGNLVGGQRQGGGLGGLLGAVLGGGAQSNPQQNAGSILGRIFGGAQSHAENSLGQATGLGAEKAGQLMQILAPIALSHIAQHVQANNLDAGGLRAALSQEQDAVQDQGGPASNLLGSVLSRI